MCWEPDSYPSSKTTKSTRCIGPHNRNCHQIHLSFVMLGALVDKGTVRHSAKKHALRTLARQDAIPAYGSFANPNTGRKRINMQDAQLCVGHNDHMNVRRQIPLPLT